MADKIQQCKICGKPKVSDGLDMCFECYNKIRADKIEPTKIETEMDKKLNTKKVKRQIHDLYEKYYGSGL